MHSQCEWTRSDMSCMGFSFLTYYLRYFTQNEIKKINIMKSIVHLFKMMFHIRLVSTMFRSHDLQFNKLAYNLQTKWPQFPTFLENIDFRSVNRLYIYFLSHYSHCMLNNSLNESRFKSLYWHGKRLYIAKALVRFITVNHIFQYLLRKAPKWRFKRHYYGKWWINLSDSI